MKLHFDSKQEFQIEAVKAITDIFEGQPLSGSDFEFIMDQSGVLLTENGFGNHLAFSKINQLTENIQLVQKNKCLKISTEDEIIRNGWNFSVEMETGTSKTYVYLRTIYDLYSLYRKLPSNVIQNPSDYCQNSSRDCKNPSRGCQNPSRDCKNPFRDC